MKKIILSISIILFGFLFASAQDNKQFVVVINAAHGGEFKGAATADGILEKELALEYAMLLKSMMLENNFKPIMCRIDDVPFDITQRAFFAQENNADLFIEIHFNENNPDPSKRGIECFVQKDINKLNNKILGKFMGAELYYVENMIFNGVNLTKPHQFYDITIPTAILELGYLSNDKDASFVKTEAGKKAICQKILNAIVRYKAHVEAN